MFAPRAQVIEPTANEPPLAPNSNDQKGVQKHDPCFQAHPTFEFLQYRPQNTRITSHNAMWGNENASRKFRKENKSVGVGRSILITWIPRDHRTRVDHRRRSRLLEILCGLNTRDLPPNQGFLVIENRHRHRQMNKRQEETVAKRLHVDVDTGELESGTGLITDS